MKNLEFTDLSAQPWSNSDIDDWQDAKRYLHNASLSELEAFTKRQLRARRRTTRLLQFYGKHSCRMSRLHILACCAIALGRFAGYSQSFDEIGEALMPVDWMDQPRTEAWRIYREACEMKRPLEVRDELWLAAHIKDLEDVRARKLDEAFYKEAEQHKEDPIWQLLKQHMEVTLEARLLDQSALDGAIALETAIAESIALTLRRLFTSGWSLLGCYAKETTKAFLSTERENEKGLFNYQRISLELLKNTVVSLAAVRVYRRGIQAKNRGHVAEEDNWTLLEQILDQQLSEINPRIITFFNNPSRYQVRASLDLKTLPVKFLAKALTTLLGQGLSENDVGEMDARFRVFKRADGSMHFLREFYCGETYRVFDSDFVVRDENGKLTFYEVFTRLGVEVEMEFAPLPEGGVSNLCKSFCWRGWRLPTFGVEAEFQGNIEKDDDAEERLCFTGDLRMRPKTRIGKFLAFRILRCPELLARLRYFVQSV